MRPSRSAVVSAIVGALVIATGVLGPVAWAQASGKSGGGSGGGSGNKGPLISNALSMTSETSWNNPNSPSWCLNEDDYDLRSFSGSLSGSYSTSYQLCDPSADYYNGVWWDAGGEGLQADVYVVGQLSGLTITAPDGTSHGAVLMGQTSSKGVTTYHYAVCYVPPYYVSTDTGTNPLAGGTWQVTLSGQMSSASWTTRDNMTDVTFQNTYCPTSEQNLR